MVEPRDDRSPYAIAIEWSSRIFTIAVQMVAPALIGAWIDARLGTKGALAIIGAVVGATAGIWSLVRMVEPLRRNRRQDPDRHDHPPQSPP